MKCKAPFNNMYFTVQGSVSPCWLTIGSIDEWSHTRSIRDIWFGDKYEEIRDRLRQQQFTGICSFCKKNHDDGVWPLAKAYDSFSDDTGWPTLMELELSNQCNLECIMCSGLLSSGIRKNRDKLPPLPIIYDEKFVEQLYEFIPHLEELRFNGGEPFAQKIVFDICEVVAELHPGLKVNIATNGTILNKNVERVMERNNLHLNLSIDSLDKNKYELIRLNGDFDQLMKNYKVFRDYAHEKNRQLTVMVNPMRNNWQEMADFVHWSHDEDIYLWFNTIRYPTHLAIWNLPSESLKEIVEKLEEQQLFLAGKRNDRIFNNFLLQVKNWYLDCVQGREAVI